MVGEEGGVSRQKLRDGRAVGFVRIGWRKVDRLKGKEPGDEGTTLALDGRLGSETEGGPEVIGVKLDCGTKGDRVGAGDDRRGDDSTHEVGTGSGAPDGGVDRHLREMGEAVEAVGQIDVPGRKSVFLYDDETIGLLAVDETAEGTVADTVVELVLEMVKVRNVVRKGKAGFAGIVAVWGIRWR